MTDHPAGPTIRRRGAARAPWPWWDDGDSIVIIVGVSIALDYAVSASTRDGDKPDRAELTIDIAGTYGHRVVWAQAEFWADPTTFGWRFARAKTRVKYHAGRRIDGRSVRSIRPLIHDLAFWARL